MSMFVSDCTNVYEDPSEGYPTMSEACQNCYQEPITDLGDPVGNCASLPAASTTTSATNESFQIFGQSTTQNVVMIVLFVLLLALLGFGVYKISKNN